MLARLFVIILMMHCMGCASQLKNSQMLTKTFDVKNYDAKTNEYSHEVAKVERLEKVDGSIHIRISTKDNNNTFSINYADEYIYYIDNFLNMDNSNSSSEVYLGDSHTFSDLSRNKFSVVFDRDSYMRIESCIFGHCNNYDNIYYSKKEAVKLRDYIVKLKSQYGNALPLFEFSSPPEGKARVYFYRLKSAPLGSKAQIEMNWSKSFKLANNKCVETDVNPGEYKVSADMMMAPDAKETFIFDAGETYFVKYTSILYNQRAKPDYTLNSMLNIFYDRNLLKLEPSVVAQYDISECDKLDVE